MGCNFTKDFESNFEKTRANTVVVIITHPQTSHVLNLANFGLVHPIFFLLFFQLTVFQVLICDQYDLTFDLKVNVGHCDI